MPSHLRAIVFIVNVVVVLLVGGDYASAGLGVMAALVLLAAGRG